ncbi:MAG: Trm112 family protein [Alphaproteobacteria bacterium]
MSEETKQGEEVDPKLLEILVCPVTRGTLHYDREAQELVSYGAGLAYPIREGIPIMLPEEARELSEMERAQAKSRRKPAPEAE